MVATNIRTVKSAGEASMRLLDIDDGFSTAASSSFTGFAQAVYRKLTGKSSGEKTSGDSRDRKPSKKEADVEESEERDVDHGLKPVKSETGPSSAESSRRAAQTEQQRRDEEMAAMFRAFEKCITTPTLHGI
eukprot:TRINITY_DN26923_c0_g1_i1.p1 TRINITY_DN26923_c0_g1~~TRINITY_DN26923_c0_g1_i1.p1  ORF type:complete len:132 (+),score=43.16 TRINITY_DN26923_c0_g1_i1:95-490(+)